MMDRQTQCVDPQQDFPTGDALTTLIREEFSRLDKEAADAASMKNIPAPADTLKIIRTMYLQVRSGSLRSIAPVFASDVPILVGSRKILVDRLKPLRAQHPEWPNVHKLASLLCRIHVRRTAYLEAMARPGSQRHDLDGRPLAPVSEEDRQYARQKLSRQSRQRKRSPTASPARSRQKHQKQQKRVSQTY